jgi:DNA transformation protein and related proteins
MPEQLHDLLNIGPATEQMLIDVGITSPEQLQQVGAIDAWLRLRSAFGSHVTIVALYALHGALQNIHWNAISAEEKQLLRAMVKNHNRD